MDFKDLNTEKPRPQANYERLSLKKMELDREGSEKNLKNKIFDVEPLQMPTKNRINLFQPVKLEEKPIKIPINEEKSNEAPINILFRLTCILKAINILRMRTCYRPLNYANEEQIKLINDNTFFPDKKKEEKEKYYRMYTEKNVKLLYFFI